MNTQLLTQLATTMHIQTDETNEQMVHAVQLLTSARRELKVWECLRNVVQKTYNKAAEERINLLIRKSWGMAAGYVGEACAILSHYSDIDLYDLLQQVGLNELAPEWIETIKSKVPKGEEE